MNRFSVVHWLCAATLLIAVQISMAQSEIIKTSFIDNPRMKSVGSTPVQTEDARIVASNAAVGDTFGSSIIIDGDVALIGTPWANCADGDECGAGYIFRLDGETWVEEAILAASDAESFDHFSSYVSLSGTTALIGAQLDDCAAGGDCGSAYLFHFNGTSWDEGAKLTSDDLAGGDRFGSVAIDGNIALIGAPRDDCVGGQDCGAAYFFRFDGSSWLQEAKLTASDQEANAKFGYKTSISGNRALVTAVEASCPTDSRCGAAYVFEYNGTSWNEITKLTASDGTVADWFGVSASLDGDVALVGAYLDDCTIGQECGAAYIYRLVNDEWSQEDKLVSSDIEANDLFGNSVVLLDNTALIGSRGDDCTAGNDCGSAYVFSFDGLTWEEQTKIVASDAAAMDQFGYFVALSKNTAFVGSRLDDCVAGSNCGAVYVFHDITTNPGIPTVSEWGLVVVTLFMLTAGTVILRNPQVARS